MRSKNYSEEPKERVCVDCQILKPASDYFHPWRGRICKKCKYARAKRKMDATPGFWKARYARYREETRQRSRDYYYNNRSVCLERNREYHARPEVKKRRKSYLKNNRLITRSMATSRNRKDAQLLVERYIRRLLRRIGVPNPTIDQIEAHRNKIRVNRAAGFFRLQQAASTIGDLQQ